METFVHKELIFCMTCAQSVHKILSVCMGHVPISSISFYTGVYLSKSYEKFQKISGSISGNAKTIEVQAK